MNWRRLIPNSISSASLIFGVLSIFKTIEGDFFLAPVFIVIAVLFDSMDGRAARALGVGGGDFGKEMDSLCDMCSFGVAPAIRIYMSCLPSRARERVTSSAYSNWLPTGTP